MNLNRAFIVISTLGPIGYLPAPGTFGTLATVVFIYLSNLFLFPAFYNALNVLLCILCFYSIKKALPSFIKNDPSEIIADEVIGTVVTFFLIPLNIFNLIVGFILFRFFDILKPLGIKKAEKLPGAWGVVMDDFAAGILSNLILQIYVSLDTPIASALGMIGICS